MTNELTPKTRFEYFLNKIADAAETPDLPVPDAGGADVGKVPTVQEDGGYALETIETGGTSATDIAYSSSSALYDTPPTNVDEALKGMEGAVGTNITQAVEDWLDENITEPTDPVIDASLTVFGAAADAKATGGKIGELKRDLEEITGEISLDTIAFGGKTYREIFEGANLIPFGDFESGLGWITTNTNGAVITDEAYVTKSHALKCFGTVSVQIRKDLTVPSTEVIILAKVRVDRYVSGGGAGFVVGSSYLLSRVTDGFETVYARRSVNAGTVSTFTGTAGSANCDAYIDDFCIIDLYSLWGSGGTFPTQAEITALYDKYIHLKNVEYKDRETKSYIGIVLGASGLAQRFTGMNQILNVGTAKCNDNKRIIPNSAFFSATGGVVMELPANPALYEDYDFTPLYVKNGDVQFLPASVTKVMTAITGLDFVTNINEVVTIKAVDIQSGSGAVFEDGDTVSIKDILYAMMLPSSNTGAQAFARVCGEKILTFKDETVSDAAAYAAFISAMNNKAGSIGMTNSYFEVASGATANNRITPNDGLRMMVEALTYPDLLKIWGKKSHTFSVGGSNPRNITVDTTVTDATLENEYTILGGKTGSYYIDSSTYGYTLVMVAKEKELLIG